ncbi:MAG: hypothetical protein ACJ714_03090 [Ornithinibacter sp.]
MASTRGAGPSIERCVVGDGLGLLQVLDLVRVASGRRPGRG